MDSVLFYDFNFTSFISYIFWWENKISCLIAIFIDFYSFLLSLVLAQSFNTFIQVFLFATYARCDLFKTSLKSTPLNNMRSTICFDLVQKPNTQKSNKSKTWKVKTFYDEQEKNKIKIFQAQWDFYFMV